MLFRSNDNVDYVANPTTANVALGIEGPLRVGGALQVAGSIGIANGEVSYTDTFNIGTATCRYNNVYAKTLTADSLNITSSFGGSGAPLSAAKITASGDIVPGTDSTYNLGTSTGPYRWTEVFASKDRKSTRLNSSH